MPVMKKHISELVAENEHTAAQLAEANSKLIETGRNSEDDHADALRELSEAANQAVQAKEEELIALREKLAQASQAEAPSVGDFSGLASHETSPQSTEIWDKL